MSKNHKIFITIISILLVITGFALFMDYLSQKETSIARAKLIAITNQKLIERKEPEVRKEELPSRGYINRHAPELFTVTAYDLSVESCGKPIGHPGYGITASGFNLSGHTWDSARTVAVDTRKFPLGSKLHVSFVDERFKKYDGIYTARDTGGAIRGNKIDFFIGDFKSNKPPQIAWDFGIRKAYVTPHTEHVN